VAKGEDIQSRLNGFAVQVMALCDGLPRTFAGKHVGEQLFRSGTACAANYAEAWGAESRNDFIHKLGIVRKELTDTLVWLDLVAKRGMVSDEAVSPVRQECDELCRIVSASRKTAETNQRQGR
jgi:four helix bundle protein